MLREKAPAKLNLGLKILGKRDDGYHDILSIFQAVDLCDELRVCSGEGLSRLDVTGGNVPEGRDNLVLRAEQLFRARFGVQDDVCFTLEKNIPVGAGLGGGSSDAAATLRLLRSFHRKDIPDEELRACGAGLGSDIPFLVDGGTAVVSGRGECVEHVEWPFDFSYVIVYPGFEVSTAWAYGRVRTYSGDGGNYASVVRKLRDGRLETGELFAALENDFEPVVFDEFPELKTLRSMLLDHGAKAALLSGSGSSVFGIFENERTASAAALMVKHTYGSVFQAKRYKRPT